MKYIEKKLKNEPRELMEHRSGFGASYDNFNDKVRLSESQEERLKKMTVEEKAAFLATHDKPLKKAILKEQGFICCYCMRRIQLDSMAVEHFIAQNRHDESPYDEAFHKSMELNYLNLLGSCKYSKRNPRDCSGIRGDKPLRVDPRNQNVEILVQYKRSGTAFSEDSRIDEDLNLVLRLNPIKRQSGEIDPSDPAINLVSNRQAAIDEAKRRMDNLSEVWSRKNLEAEIRYWLTPINGQYREYCMAAVHYLQSKLKYAQ